MPDDPNKKLYQGAAIDPPDEVAPGEFDYAELDVTTNFSFLRGASHPDELVYTAAQLGYRAMALTDVNSLAGVVRAFEAARKIKNFKLIVGARLVFIDGTNDLLVWPTDRAAYARLCKLLTIGRRRAEKGECHLGLDDFLDHHQGMFAAIASTDASRVDLDSVHQLHDALGKQLSLAVSLHHSGDDETLLDSFIDLSDRTHIPLLATNQVHYHDENRRMLQDVLTCVREGCTIHEAGFRLYANAERYLKSPRQMHELFKRHPQAIEHGLHIAQRCSFSLDQLKYEYPTETAPPNVSPSQYLRDLTYEHARDRYPTGIPQRVLDLLEKELNFICGSKYESYFLTVFDLVRFAQSKGILCQGRGSAANSAVCYCLGVTSVDPNQFQLVFERFASSARAEPPDIDIDFEHERREEVIQYVYKKYGRDRAAMTASLTTYRGRSAVRDVGKALGFGQDMIDQLASKLDWWHSGSLSASQLREAGVNPSDPGVQRLIQLTRELLGFPRHLSQHVGGMVIARSPLNELVPVENAAMEDRTVIEWDKDDLDVIGLFKVDILALGMLTAISKGLKLINDRSELTGETPFPPKPIELHTIPPEDPDTYEMLCDADSVGVFQVESRAQMSMLPRLQPKKFYDLVVEVAIVRPGPIQGKMVHPYLQRRERLRSDPTFRVEYPKPELEEVLRETLGVPLFQEQAMRLAMVAARFTPEEADQLRRAMAAWKRHGGIGKFHHKFINGMLNNGYELDFAERCFQQISGFGEYGFPESHAASFARLVYASAWIKRHHPAAFCCALLNSQPMGFYAPAQLVRDAKQHGVEVRPIDVNESEWDCMLEDAKQFARTNQNRNDRQSWGSNGPALRLGFRQIKGLQQAEIDKLIHVRNIDGQFISIDELQHRSRVSSSTIRRLADADAFGSMKMSRRHAAWDALALDPFPQTLPDKPVKKSQQLMLPIMQPIEETLADYSTTGLSLRDHPVSFARQSLATHWRIIPSCDLLDEKKCPSGKWVSIAGLVICRQRPGTASGVVFITLEDETGIANLIVWNQIYERFRPAARHATLLQVDGVVQREGKVIHVVARQLFDRSELLTGLVQHSRDFH